MASVLPEQLSGIGVYMVGIKGTGMAALAEILVAYGARVDGSDVEERFYTDELLKAAGIHVREGYAAENLRNVLPPPQIVIHSAAYDPNHHPELVEARRRGLPVILYTDALGELSRRAPSVGVSGVHGKTTTTALVASIAQELELPGTVLAGSAIASVAGRATLVQGHRFFVAETCEYRRHFLSFSPRAILVTGIEPDHLDYFSGREDIEKAFLEYAMRLEPDGTLIYCCDNEGAARVAEAAAAERPDVRLLPYGTRARGEGRVAIHERRAGALDFAVAGEPFTLHVPGDHNVLNAAGALLIARLVNEWVPPSLSADRITAGARAAIAGFRGTRRRCEVVGEIDGVLVMDDYAHHPTAITATLDGLRSFYPGRRIVLSFMSHTYSRTLALLDDFARALAGADVVVLHDIYASAREANPGGIDGEVLARATRRHATVYYVPGVIEAGPLVRSIVRPGDLFCTMGAGDNWRLGRWLLDAPALETAP